jgi:hypothetical protein
MDGHWVSRLLLLALLIQIPYVQDKIKDKAVTYLEGKIHTKVRLGTSIWDCQKM